MARTTAGTVAAASRQPSPIDGAPDRRLPASWTEKSVASIVFFTLALGGLIPKLAGAALLLLGLISVASLSFRRAWRPPDLLPLERLLILSVVLFVAIWLAAWWWHGLDPWGQLGVGRIGRLLLIVPIFLLVRQIPAAEAAWWHGLSIGAILFGLYAWLSLANGVIGPFGERITGPVNPLYFGALALSFALMLLPRVSDPDLSAAARTLAIFAILMGMSASALSGSRGTWLALPILLLIYLFTFGARQPPRWRFGLPLVVCAIAMALILGPFGPMKERTFEAAHDLQALWQGETTDHSLSRRFRLWTISIELNRDHPLTGVGPGAFPRTVSDAVEDEELPEYFMGYLHPHNEYLSAYNHAGLIGLLALMLMLASALARHVQVWRTGLKRLRMIGWSGLAGLGTLIVLALSESLFERNSGVVWFALLCALPVGLLAAGRQLEFAGTRQRRHRLSVIVICKNQCAEIDRCLGSVSGWADEIIVLDSGSSDGTPDRCRRYTDQVFATDWPGFGRQKQRALDRASGDWVLSLDADERLSEELRREIDRVLAEPQPEYTGYCLRWRTHAFGRQLSFGHWTRAPLRLFRRDQGRFTLVPVHEKVLLAGDARPGLLESPLDHFVYRDLHHAREKLGQYARLQAEERHRNGRRARWPWTPALRALANLLDNYLVRGAVLDGRAGWTMSRLLARYTYDKYRLLHRLGRQMQ